MQILEASVLTSQTFQANAAEHLGQLTSAMQILEASVLASQTFLRPECSGAFGAADERDAKR